MNINNLTVGQAKDLAAMFGSAPPASASLNRMIGKKVIIRTSDAGNWFGRLVEKAGSEVILEDARRMWFWYAEKGISLSACALYGVKDESKIVEPVEQVWLAAIEIIPCTDLAIKSIEEKENVEAQ